MSKIILRDYQLSVVNETRQRLKDGFNHLMVQLPTGGGKTIIFSYIAQNAIPKGKKVLILTDRDELLKQAGGTLSDFNINPYFIKAGAKIIDHRKSCFIAMYQTDRKSVV